MSDRKEQVRVAVAKHKNRRKLEAKEISDIILGAMRPTWRFGEDGRVSGLDMDFDFTEEQRRDLEAMAARVGRGLEELLLEGVDLATIDFHRALRERRQAERKARKG